MNYIKLHLLGLVNHSDCFVKAFEMVYDDLTVFEVFICANNSYAVGKPKYLVISFEVDSYQVLKIFFFVLVIFLVVSFRFGPLSISFVDE